MRENYILKTLLEIGEVTWKPQGNSMSPRIHSGDEVVIKSCQDLQLQVNDIVYCKVKGKYYLHLISAIDGDRYQISNNSGYVNGWINKNNIFGICVKVKDKVLLTDEVLRKK